MEYSGMAIDNEYLLKICVLGSTQSHKDHFIQTFTGRKQWMDPQMITLGIDITTTRITVGNLQIKLIIPNTAGQEIFGKLRPSYYRGASACIILFDKTDRKSFDDVLNWKKEFDQYLWAIHPKDPKTVKLENDLPSFPMALVGLLTSSTEDSEKILFDEGLELASQLNMVYFESSPTDKQRASQIFMYLARQVIEG